MAEVRREAALRSALGRLPLAVFIVDDQRVLSALNAKATELMQVEGLRGDIVASRPSHPLSQLILQILHDRDHVNRVELTFPRGSRYIAEPSRRSEKGMERWLVLLLDEVRQSGEPFIERLLDQWNLTDREREVAMSMARGSTSREICEAMKIAPTTLKTHVKQILAKSAARTRPEFLSKLLRGR